MKALGINYPIAKGNQGYFESVYETFANERIKLINLMNTIEGERYMQPEFGLGIHKYLFEPITTDLKMKLQREIENKIGFWIPNLNIDELEVNIIENVDKNQVDITLRVSLVGDPLQYDTVTFTF